MKLIECVPNFSEGRDRAIVDAIAAEISGTEGAMEKRISPDREQQDIAAPAASREAGSAAPSLQVAPPASRVEEKPAPASQAKLEAAPAADLDLGTDPEVWVKRIEALRREGRSAEAEVLLAEFRKRFPDYPADRLPK